MSWSAIRETLVHTEQKLLDNLALHGGPTIKASDQALEPIEPAPGDWLLVPEAPHLGSDDPDYPSLLLDELIGFVRSARLPVAVVLHDIMPLDASSRRGSAKRIRRHGFCCRPRRRRRAPTAPVRDLRPRCGDGRPRASRFAHQRGPARRLADPQRASPGSAAADRSHITSGAGAHGSQSGSSSARPAQGRSERIPVRRNGRRPQEPTRRHGCLSATDRSASRSRRPLQRGRSGDVRSRGVRQPAGEAVERPDRAARHAPRRIARGAMGISLRQCLRVARRRLWPSCRRKPVARETLHLLG